MGQLTAPDTALIGPNGQTAVGSPDQVKKGFYRMGIADEQTQHPYDPSQPNPNPPPQSPHIGTPSFQQAATSGAIPGGANAMSPGLNKAGKLATILMSGLQGALAGRAKSEETTAATGGRRSGGAGMGFEAGYNLPWQRAGMSQELAQKQAQTGVLQSEAQQYNIPGVGPIPGWLAKAMGPAYIRAQSARDVQGMKGDTAESIQGQKSETAENVANINKRFMSVPNVGLYDTQSGSIVPGTQQGVTVDDKIMKDYQLPPEFLGKPMSLSNLAQLERAQSYQNVVTQGAAGPALVNRNQASPNFGKTTPLGLGAPSLGAPREVADVNNPGQTVLLPGTQAIGQPGVQSASVQVPKKAAAAEVPTNIGNQKVAFTTMIQHAQLLRQAAKALNNGDVQTLSGLENAFKNEFGYGGPITAKAISDAYGGEVTNVIAKGHITDKELEKTGKTLDPTKQNYETIDSVLRAYESLAQSKMTMLNQQTKSAVSQSQPKGNAVQPPAGNARIIRYDSQGNRIQ